MMSDNCRVNDCQKRLLVAALEDILSMHDGNQPAALNMPDLDYARRTIKNIHLKVRATLASIKEQP